MGTTTDVFFPSPLFPGEFVRMSSHWKVLVNLLRNHAPNNTERIRIFRLTVLVITLIVSFRTSSNTTGFVMTAAVSTSHKPIYVEPLGSTNYPPCPIPAQETKMAPGNDGCNRGPAGPRSNCCSSDQFQGGIPKISTVSKLWSNPQRLELNRREVFGPDLLPDPTRSGPPNDMVYLEISHLRLAATRALQRMNLTPA